VQKKKKKRGSKRMEPTSASEKSEVAKPEPIQADELESAVDHRESHPMIPEIDASQSCMMKEEKIEMAEVTSLKSFTPASSAIPVE
jgi:hypothetical protein